MFISPVEAHGVFPPFDTSYFATHVFWLAISFGLFYLFISRVIVPRIGGTIEMRRDRIAADLDQAARMKQEADDAISAYQQELQAARGRAQHIAKEARLQLEQQVSSEREAALALLDRKLAQAEEVVAERKSQALATVSKNAETTTAAIVQHVLGRSVAAEQIQQAVAIRRVG